MAHRRVLVVQHDHVSPPGPIGERFVDRGHDVEEFLVVDEAAFHGDPNVVVDVPDFRAYDVVVVMGAVWGVYDEDVVGNWLVPEKRRLREALDAGVPVLGLCFGGQLLAEAVGGSVARSPAPELGWHLVHSDDPGLVPPGAWFQYHYDRWALPEGVPDVARNAAASQAFIAGRALAVQFHPELTAAMLEGWLANGGTEDLRRAGLDPDVLLRHTRVVAEDARRRAHDLVDAFLDRVA
ncbi:MAG: type 1 glutamine amidotransferase [Kineosporiaceae bacterium]